MEFANCFACFNVPGTSALKVIGPATHNPLWLQLKADILQRPVEAIAFNEAVSVGALLTAAPDIPPPPTFVTESGEIPSITALSAQMEKLVSVEITARRRDAITSSGGALC